MEKHDGLRKYAGLLWLLAGCVSLLFMGGKWNIVIVTWIGSIFFVRFYRARRGFWGILLSVPFVFAAAHVFFIGLAVQVTLAFQILIAVSYTLYILVPCAVDRLLYRRIGNTLLSTLVYPAALIVMQLLLSLIEPLGTVLTWTGSLFSLKPLIQIVSITGVWGPSFLVGWLASIVNSLWEEKFDLAKAGLPLGVFTAVFAAVMLWGGARMVFFAPGPGTVKTGSVVVSLPEENLFWSYLDMPAAMQAERKDEYRGMAQAVQEELFAASETLAPSGMKILSWGSGNAVVFAEDEEGLILRLREFAKEHDLYFFPCLLVLGDYSGPDRTKVLAIRPDGGIEYTHYKGRNPNAGYYQGMSVEVMDTPYGRIASPICYEMESHRLIRQAGEQDVDILIVPGDEPSRDNAVLHTELSMFRGIENGCSVLRTTLEGLTMGMDYQGRVLSWMNYYVTTRDRTILTELPIKGARTVYAAIGDWFAYLCAALLAVMIALGIRNAPVAARERHRLSR